MNTNNHERRKVLIDRYLKNGLSELSDKEVLELLLSYSARGRDFSSTAQELIDEYGSFSAVMDADPGFLTKIHKLDDKASTLLRLIPQLSRIISLENSKELRLYSAENAKNYFQSYFIGISSETLAVVCTNEKFKIIAEKAIAFGSASSVSVSCRKIVEFALKNNAHYIFIAHNHPIGNAEPSANDLRSTETILKTLENIGITFVDHIIVSKNSVISMKELPYTKALFSNGSSCGYIFNCKEL